MKINQITLTDLRRMNGKEGLILQGCGGEIKEWMDGINKMLTDKGILLTIQSLSMFLCFKMTALPVYFIHLKMSTLTSASLQCGDCNPTQPLQGCGYPDYVDNRLGGFEPEQNKEEKAQTRLCIDRSGRQYIQSVRNFKRTLKQNGMAPFIPHFLCADF